MATYTFAFEVRIYMSPIFPGVVPGAPAPEVIYGTFDVPLKLPLLSRRTELSSTVRPVAPFQRVNAVSVEETGPDNSDVDVKSLWVLGLAYTMIGVFPSADETAIKVFV